MAKKLKRKLKGKRKYAVGGMYSNTIPAGLMTTNLVSEESNPAIQIAREEAFTNTQENLQTKASKLSDNIEEQTLIDDQTLLNEAALQEQKQQLPDKIMQTGLKTWGTTDKVGKYLANRATKKTSQMLADQVTQQAGKKGAEIAVDTTMNYGYKTAANIAQDKLVQEGAKKMGEETVKAAGTEGAKAVAVQAASQGPNLSPYALAANVIGTGIGMAADDQDPTTWTAGEASGDILAEAGEWAGYGATLGTIVPGIGNAIGTVVGGVVGAVKGTIEGLVKRRKARRLKRKQTAERKERVDTANVETGNRFGTAMSNVRAGNIKQKTQYGYDLGINTTAKMGGMRLGMPRY